MQSEKTILWHAKHSGMNANLEWLVQVKNKCKEVEIIIVCSSYNIEDKKLYARLIEKGNKGTSKFTPNLEEIYNLADFYAFP